MLDARHQMRTTPTLDDDALAAARVLAKQRKQPIGSVISALARVGLFTAHKPRHQTLSPQRNWLTLLPVQNQRVAG